MYRTIAIAAVALALAGCTSFNGATGRSRPITVFYEAADGSVKSYPLHLDTPEPSPMVMDEPVSSGGMTDYWKNKLGF